MYPPFGPVLIELGPLTLRWYGILMMIAIGLAIVVAGREVARRGLDPNTLYDMVFWVLIPAGIGARLYYVFIQSPRTPEGIGRFLENPLLIFQIWTGGIHIFGAFIFGGVALVLYCRWRRLPTLVYLDALAVALPLAQAVGRLGNFINQELYGPPTTLPWGLRIDPDHRIPPYNDLTTYPETARFHPLFLYELLWNFIGFGLLFWISRRFMDSAPARRPDPALPDLVSARPLPDRVPANRTPGSSPAHPSTPSICCRRSLSSARRSPWSCAITGRRPRRSPRPDHGADAAPAHHRPRLRRAEPRLRALARGPAEPRVAHGARRLGPAGELHPGDHRARLELHDERA